MFENEEWALIEGFENYEISNHGRVRRVGSDRTRKISLNNMGVPVLVLYRENDPSRYLRQVNKLVATTFLPPPTFQDETSVWHIDGDLTNCRASNLKWDTRARVLEWNAQNRHQRPQHHTPRVKNNRTGVIYENAFDCAMSEGKLEGDVIKRVEQGGIYSPYDDSARYRYIND